MPASDAFRYDSRLFLPPASPSLFVVLSFHPIPPNNPSSSPQQSAREGQALRRSGRPRHRCHGRLCHRGCVLMLYRLLGGWVGWRGSSGLDILCFWLGNASSSGCTCAFLRPVWPPDRRFRSTTTAQTTKHSAARPRGRVRRHWGVQEAGLQRRTLLPRQPPHGREGGCVQRSVVSCRVVSCPLYVYM